MCALDAVLCYGVDDDDIEVVYAASTAKDFTTASPRRTQTCSGPDGQRFGLKKKTIAETLRPPTKQPKSKNRSVASSSNARQERAVSPTAATGTSISKTRNITARISGWRGQASRGTSFGAQNERGARRRSSTITAEGG